MREMKGRLLSGEHGAAHLMSSGGRAIGSFEVIPREPPLGMSSNLAGIFLECDEVVEGIGPGELAGVNEAHEHVADVSAMLGAKVEAVFPVEDGPFERPFTDIIVKWSAGNSKKEGELLPSFEKVFDGLAKTRVRLDPFFIKLGVQPAFELIHHGAGFNLVELETLLGGEVSFLRDGIDMVDFSEGLDKVAALFRKVRVHVDEVSPAVSEAV